MTKKGSASSFFGGLYNSLDLSPIRNPLSMGLFGMLLITLAVIFLIVLLVAYYLLMRDKKQEIRIVYDEDFPKVKQTGLH